MSLGGHGVAVHEEGGVPAHEAGAGAVDVAAVEEVNLLRLAAVHGDLPDGAAVGVALGVVDLHRVTADLAQVVVQSLVDHAVVRRGAALAVVAHLRVGVELGGLGGADEHPARGAGLRVDVHLDGDSVAVDREHVLRDAVDRAQGRLGDLEVVGGALEQGHPVAHVVALGVASAEGELGGAELVVAVLGAGRVVVVRRRGAVRTGVDAPGEGEQDGAEQRRDQGRQVAHAILRAPRGGGDCRVPGGRCRVEMSSRASGFPPVVTFTYLKTSIFLGKSQYIRVDQGVLVYIKKPAFWPMLASFWTHLSTTYPQVIVERFRQIWAQSKASPFRLFWRGCIWCRRVSTD